MSKSDNALAVDSAAGAPARSAPRSSSRMLLALVVLLVAVTCAGYYTYARLLAPRLAALETRLDDVDRTEASRQAALATIAAETTAATTAIRSELASQLQVLEERQQSAETTLEALSGQTQETELDWVLAETEYLILAATQRLALERDVSTALAALRAADNRLRLAEHPAFIAVREQLAHDIGALDGIERPDLEGLALYLAEALGRIDALPTKPIADVSLSFAQTEEQPLVADNWRGVLGALWRDLVSLVDVKDSELPDDVLFDPKLRYFLQQNLKLELSSARLAVLTRDSANLRASLSLVDHQLEQYYDSADAGVAALRGWLAEHRDTELDPAVPAIAASLDAVRAARASLHAVADPSPEDSNNSSNTPHDGQP